MAPLPAFDPSPGGFAGGDARLWASPVTNAGKRVDLDPTPDSRIGMSERAFAFGPFQMFPARGVVLANGRAVRVGSRALLILIALVERHGALVTKDALTAAAWPDTHVEDVNLRVHLTALRKALGDGQDGARYIVNVPGRGYRFVAPVTEITSEGAASAVADETPPPAAPGLPQGVPTALTHLIGRSDVIGLLAAQLDISRMVTIVGPGGIGKTSVALAVALRRASAADDVCFIDLSAVTDPQLVPAVIAGALSVSTLVEDITKALIRALRHRDLIVVLDNCEHLIDAVAIVVEAILKTSTKVRLLATTREPLRIEGERIHRLAALAVPVAQPGLTAAMAMGYPAIQLFVERATALVEDFTLTDAEAPILADICRRLDGIPLAVELAAARVDLFSLPGLAQGLNDRFGLLTRGRRTALPRHQTLRATLDWSYDLLPPAEQALLRCLGIFPGSFTLDDLAAVAQGDALEGVTSLVVKSMLAADVSGEVVRYRLLETTREYALEKLGAAGEAKAAIARHADHLRALLRREDGILSQAAWLARCSRIMDDVRIALDRSFQPGGDHASGIALTVAAIPIWFRLSLLAEHRRTIDLALDRLQQADDADPHSEMLLQSALGLNLYFSNGPVQTVTTRLRRGLALAQQLDDRVYQLPIIWMLYFVSSNAGDYRGGYDFAEAYGRAMEGSPDTLAPARYDRLRGRALHNLGRHADALPLFDQALTAVRTSQIFARLNAYDNDHWISTRAVKARLLWIQGRADDALAELEGCLADAQAIDHAQSICWALAFNLCPVALWCGRLDLARRLVGLLLVQSRKTFAHWHVWGRLYADILSQLEAGAPMVALPPGSPDCLAQADLMGTLAISLAGPVVQTRIAADSQNWCAPEILRAQAEQMQDDPAAAESVLVRARAIAAGHGALAWGLRVAMSLARLYQAQGRTVDALAVLAPVYGRFSQGFDTLDLQEAGALLAALERRESAAAAPLPRRRLASAP